MQKLYEIFKVLKILKRIVCTETIGGNTVFQLFKSVIRTGLMMHEKSGEHSPVQR
jgi:hypothetical protein